MREYIKKLIAIHGITDVTDFVTKASMVDGDVIVSRGRWVVDGKSAMGMFSLAVDEGITVDFPKDATEFAEYIAKFEITL